MIQNNVIRSDDPQAVEKLQAKLDKLTEQHTRMRACGVRKALLCNGTVCFWMCRPLTFLSGVHGEAAAGQSRRFLLY